MSEADFKEALHQRLERLKADIKQAQAQIEDKQSFVKQRQDQIEHIIKLLEAEGVHIDRTDLDGTVPVSLAEVLAKVLRDHGKQPMYYKRLMELAEQTGYKIPGQNPLATVSAQLHRKKDQFVRLGPGMWGLAEWGLPAQSSRAGKRRKTRQRTARKSR